MSDYVCGSNKQEILPVLSDGENVFDEFDEENVFDESKEEKLFNLLDTGDITAIKFFINQNYDDADYKLLSKLVRFEVPELVRYVLDTHGLPDASAFNYLVHDIINMDNLEMLISLIEDPESGEIRIPIDATSLAKFLNSGEFDAEVVNMRKLGEIVFNGAIKREKSLLSNIVYLRDINSHFLTLK